MDENLKKGSKQKWDKWTDENYNQAWVFMLHCTVWLHRESSIYSEKSWFVFLGSYYKIYIILSHGELEFCEYIDKLHF